jgi:hypothetical protein
VTVVWMASGMIYCRQVQLAIQALVGPALLRGEWRRMWCLWSGMRAAWDIVCKCSLRFKR